MRRRTKRRIRRAVLAALVVLAGLAWFVHRRSQTWYLIEVAAEGYAPVPFFLGVPNGGDHATIVNGDERLPVDILGREPLEIRVPVLGSRLTIEELPGGRVKGRWRPQVELARFDLDLPLRGREVDQVGPLTRFGGSGAPGADISGNWRVDIADFGVGRAVLRQAPDGSLSGTLIPPDVGDMRHLSGRVIGNRFAMSTFDGIHAYLVTGTIDEGGDRLSGLWTYGGLNEWTFTARHGNEPPVASLTSAHLKAGFDRITLPELTDEYRGKPVIVDLFGTWCPACMDLTPELVALHDRYAKDGLVLLSVAFESDGDRAGTVRRLEEFRSKYGVSWDIKVRYAKDLTDVFPPELDRVLGFPVTIFIRRDGTVAAVHTAFVSDAARPEHEAVLDNFDRWAKEIVTSK